MLLSTKGKVGEVLLRHKASKKLGRFTIFGMVVLTAIICSTIGYKSYTLNAQSKEYQSQLSELKKENKELSEKEDEIQEYKKYVKTNEYIENTARQKLGLVYPGEIVFEADDEDK